jgi:hypothetical protein
MSKSLIKRLQQIHVGHWLLFLVLSQTVYFVMLLVSIPSISREAGGMRIFDMQPLGYTYDYAYQFLLRLSERGYDLYRHVQLPLDVLYPALLCLTGICTIVLLVRLHARVNPRSKLSVKATTVRIAMFVPMLVMISDYMENLFIFAMLSFKSAVPPSLVWVSNLFTLLKSMSTTVFYMIVLPAGISVLALWIGQLARREQVEG